MWWQHGVLPLAEILPIYLFSRFFLIYIIFVLIITMYCSSCDCIANLCTDTNIRYKYSDQSQTCRQVNISTCLSHVLLSRNIYKLFIGPSNVFRHAEVYETPWSTVSDRFLLDIADVQTLNSTDGVLLSVNLGICFLFVHIFPHTSMIICLPVFLWERAAHWPGR